jgi:uncharacterized membrane protein
MRPKNRRVSMAALGCSTIFVAAALLASAANAAQFTILDAPDAQKGTLALGINASSAVTGWFRDAKGNYNAFVRVPDGTYAIFLAESQQSEGVAIDDKGAVAGIDFTSSLSFSHGFLRTSSGKIKSFDPKDSTVVFVGGINDKNEIAGTYWDSNIHPHGYLLVKSGALTTFDAPDSHNTEANGLNANGDIAGAFFDSGNTAHGYVRLADGSFAEFDATDAGQGGSLGTYAVAISATGVVAGYAKTSSLSERAFLRDASGALTEFDVPGASGLGAQASAINRRGEIAGSYVDPHGQTRGFVREPNGDIETFALPHAKFTQPLGINDSGVIVGYFKDKAGNHGFLRAP